MLLGLSLWAGTGVAGIVCVAGLLLATSEWWCPRLLQWWSRVERAPTALLQRSEDLANLRACLPHVQRCRELIGPYAGDLNMGLAYLNTRGNTFIELIRELGYLTQSLSALGLRCPTVYGGNDESDSELLFRLQLWNMYLVDLAVMIQHDDIASARQLEPLERARQPTSGKSDAQY